MAHMHIKSEMLTFLHTKFAGIRVIVRILHQKLGIALICDDYRYKQETFFGNMTVGVLINEPQKSLEQSW